VARLDALMRATPFAPEDVLLVSERYPSARGTRRLRQVLRLVDGGAASPKETWLRLLLIDAGLPMPTTQIPVVEGYSALAMLDMGWPEFGVAAEYDGDQHRSDRRQFVKDHWRMRKLAEIGWIVIRVIAEDRPADVIDRVRRALLARGWRPGGTAVVALAG
ncbi:cullin%2C a subunit of E3 ubiquitin ligase, partial [Mycobacterium terramassiliense]